MQNQKQSALLTGKLNDVLNHELTAVIRFILESSTVQGIQFEPLRQIYRDEVLSGVRQAQYLADEIVRLGGIPQAKLEVLPRPHEIASMAEMIERDVRAEEDDAKNYEALAVLADEAGDPELKLQMEQQVTAKRRHAEHLCALRAFPASC